jgi:GNAT superfamily N-acetyltransferase
MISPNVLRYPQVDLELARRLERAEVLATVAYVETRRLLQPSSGASWLEISGVHAVFDGPDSPLTQTFGLGAFEPTSDATLDALESFFAERGVATAHEVSSLASPVTWQRLSSRGYSPIEASTVLVRPTTPAPRTETGRVTARLVERDELSSWCQVVSEGLSSESAELVAVMQDLAPIVARSEGVHCFAAEHEGKPIAGGVLALKNGIALLGGASTLPAERRQGAQAALLQARLEHAAKLGVELAMVVAGPGSSSQRNAERKGFRPVYVRSKWCLPLRKAG